MTQPMNNSSMPAQRHFWTSSLLHVGAFVMSTLLLMGSSAFAQNATFSLETIEVYPGQDALVMPMTLSTDVELNAFEIGIQFHPTLLHLTELSYANGVLADATNFEFFMGDVDPVSSRIHFNVVLSSESPFGESIAVGDDQLLAEMKFDMDDGQLAGSLVPIDFAAGLNRLPAENVAFSAGTSITPSLVNGGFQITNDNFLIALDSVARPGDEGHSVEIVGINTDDVQGYSLSMDYDEQYISPTGFSTENSITGEVGAEFFQPVINIDQGYIVLGVLLDLIPPFDGQVIPPSGLGIPYCYLLVDIREEAIDVESTSISFVDGLGTPPTSNVFVIDNQSISPVTVDGTIEIQAFPDFIRGEVDSDTRVNITDAVVIALHVNSLWSGPFCEAAADTNDDGSVNIADAVFLLQYLFSGGPILQEPFPIEGQDPTQSMLPCEGR